MKKSFFVVIALFVLMAAYYFYREFGGNVNLEFRLEQRSFQILGEPFKGPYDSPRLENIFFRAKELSDSLGSSLVVVNYGSDEDAETVNQFIGFLKVDNDIIPEGYTLEIFEPPFTITTTIGEHNAFMPKPETVSAMAADFAAENGKTLGPVSIEIYRSDRELIVYFLTE